MINIVMINSKKYLLSLLAASVTLVVFSHSGDIKKSSSNSNDIKRKAASCNPSTGRTFLEYNNVKTIVETSGYMWEDRSTGFGAYEVPKDGGRISIYAGALWMGGLTDGQVLKLAAHLYHRDNDFWTGPLTVSPATPGDGVNTVGFGEAEITPDVCDEYDRFWQTTRQEAQLHFAYHVCDADPDCNPTDEFPEYVVPKSFLEWPAIGDESKFQDRYLAPFFDFNEDGFYDPSDGDFPGYDLLKENDCPKPRGGRVDLFGDYNLWYIFNDKGNVHTETGGNPIGMEIKAQAFAFATSDEINSMTFYNYELINRSTTRLNETYFGQYVDADIGCSGDDYAGVDVQRGFGYTYGGTAVDGEECFGATPWSDGISPAIGVDFFEGPYQDNDGVDNPLTTDVSKAIDEKGIPYEGLGLGYGDGVVDNERMGMSRFVYFNRAGTGPPYGRDPGTAIEFYNYMRGVWVDGTNFVFGGTGHITSPEASGYGNINASYIFPGDSDPLHWGTRGVDPNETQDWTEQSAGNDPGDRRFFQAAGPFTLDPGALNNITVGVVYARGSGSDPFQSVELVRLADDKAQKLFDNCFRLIDGPDAPEVEVQEFDQELVLYISNCATSNNANEDYAELDPNINLDPYRIYLDTVDPSDDPNATGADVGGTGICDNCYYKDSAWYKFQGYQVFQLVNASVGPEELDDVTKARLVAQCDIQDGVSRLINFEFNEDLKAAVPVEKVDGRDEGLVHTFQIKEDAFAQGDVALVNYKKYHFMVISYSDNNYRDYNPNDPLFLDGQQLPYLRGRQSCTGSIKSYTGIPHKPSPGTVLNSKYGDTPLIVREEGKGNGGLVVDLTADSEQEILSKNIVTQLKHQKGASPVDVKIVDPLRVPNDDFELRFVPSSDPTDIALGRQFLNAKWHLTRLSDGETVISDTVISYRNEQLVLDWGLSLTIGQLVNVTGTNVITDKKPDLLLSTAIYSDSTKQWLSGVPDNDGSPILNWIRSGLVNEGTGSVANCDFFDDYVGLDDEEQFEGVLGGTFAPFALVAYGDCYAEPVSESVGSTNLSLVKLDDLSSVDIVITDDQSKWTRAAVVEMQNDPALAFGNANKMDLREQESVGKDGEPDGTGTGMSWFPGYAIDINTGERLNIAFAEDSWLGGYNGRDMIWNPTSELFSGAGDAVLGGKHYVYVFQNQSHLGAERMPAYDGGNYLETNLSSSSTSARNNVWKSCMWVGMPLLNPSQEFLASDVRLKIRVSSEYERYSHNSSTSQSVSALDGSENSWYPLYSFNTADVAAEYVDSVAISRLDGINIVPNPYYAFSEYEESRLENRVKMVNLPKKCTIKIYNVGGQLIRTFTKDSDITFIDWDLTNHANVPISGGMYIIHVNVPDVGEKVVKFMAIMRTPDLENL